MNIFILDKDPKKAAISQCDKHVCKMVIESTQMLCLALPPDLSPYKQVFKHHPCSKWVLYSSANYEWMIEHAIALSQEYTFRYNREHKCARHICMIIYRTWKIFRTWNFVENKLTPFVQAMPDQYKDSDAVRAYRAYYKGEKKHFAKWNNGREAPDWWL